MIAWEFNVRRWTGYALGSDRRHVLENPTTTLCGLGGERPYTITDWTECAICAHKASDEHEVWWADVDSPMASPDPAE